MLAFFYIFLTIILMNSALINLYPSKINIKEKILLLIVTYISGCLAYCISESLIILLVTISIIIWLYIRTKNMLISIGIPILATIITLISDSIITYLDILVFKASVPIDRSSSCYFILYLVDFIIIFIISKIIGSLINKKMKILIEDIKGKSSVLIVLSLVLTFSIILANIIIGLQNGFTNESVRINSILFSMYFILLIIIMFVLVSNIKKEMKFESAKNEFQNLQEYTSNLEVLYNDMRVFRHDYINILSSMAGYIENRDIDGLEKHFSENIVPLSEGMKSNNFKIGLLQNIRIPEIKGIIASKVIRAQEAGIDVSIEVMEPIESIAMNIIDLSRVVGILLDNSIEACEKCEKPYIRLGLINKESSIIMALINSAPEDTPPVYKLYKKGFSTKGENRGLGLSNLKEIIGRYKNISLDTIVKECEFVQSIEIINKD